VDELIPGNGVMSSLGMHSVMVLGWYSGCIAHQDLCD